jgi:lipid II isoglutaminyl synthase (glutamine-hydrolysing)
MRFAAVLVGKGVSAASRLLKRGAGTTLPGMIAERLHPALLHDLSQELGCRPVVITGTNGKTTTAKMLAGALGSSGCGVVRNDSGSNLRNGIGSALVASAKVTGGMRGDVAVLEVDEAATATVVPEIEPGLVVITNLSRDQLDRYGDLDTLAELIGGTLARMPDTRVLLNADDPLVAGLGMLAAGPVSYFGLDGASCAETGGAGVRAGAPCPNCATPVHTTRSFYGHLGDWICPRCGEARPSLDFVAREVRLGDSSSSFLLDPGEGADAVALSLPVAGLHNVYNALAAAAAASLSGVPLTETAAALDLFTPAFGRTERMQVDGSSVVLLLAKNPAGAEQALATALRGSEGSPVALVLNDNAADGTDVSWIWDVDFENLEFGDRQLVVGGTRAEDLAVRLKYALLHTTRPRTENDPAEAVRILARLTPPHRTSYVVATYTAMLAIRSAFAHSGDRFSSLGARLGA